MEQPLTIRAFLAALPLLAAAPLVAGPLENRDWAPDTQVQHALVQGTAWTDVVPSTDGAGLIHAAIDIAAPPRTVWAVMTDCRMASRLITTMTSCRVVDGDQRSGWDVREQVTKANFFVPEMRNVFRSDYHPYTVIRFHRTSGDLKIMEGEWRLEPINGGTGTELIYINRIAANLYAPAFLVRASLKHDTPKALMNLRRESVEAAQHGVGA